MHLISRVSKSSDEAKWLANAFIIQDGINDIDEVGKTKKDFICPILSDLLIYLCSNLS